MEEKQASRHISTYSKEERQELFQVVIKKIEDRYNFWPKEATQDPYDFSTWPNDIYIKELTKKVRQIPYKEPLKYFEKYYSFMDNTKIEKSILGTLLWTQYDIFEDNNDSPIATMIKIPLYYTNIKSLSQSLNLKQIHRINNRIQAGFFLQELVYGYSNVLSIHFRCVHDWFIAPIAGRIGRIDNEKGNINTIGERIEKSKLILYNQYIVEEKVNTSLSEYLRSNPSINTLRAVLFQVFHALETAWYTNQYTHNNLFTENIFLKESVDGKSLRDKHFVYRRLVDNVWYVLDKKDLNNMVIKIGNMDLSRFFVPAKKDHVDKKSSVHVHSTLAEGGPLIYGNPGISNANRYIDVKSLLLNILEFWPKFDPNPDSLESGQFYEMCERMIDFGKITKISMGYFYTSFKYEEELRLVGNKITAKNYHQCPKIAKLLNRPGYVDNIGNTKVEGVFVRRYDKDEVRNATSVLNDVFFESYKFPNLFSGSGDPNGILYNYEVVSFITHPYEAVMLKESPYYSFSSLPSINTYKPMDDTGVLCCSVCGVGRVTHITRDDEPLCGEACYEFKYFFGSRTVCGEE